MRSDHPDRSAASRTDCRATQALTARSEHYRAGGGLAHAPQRRKSRPFSKDGSPTTPTTIAIVTGEVPATPEAEAVLLGTVLWLDAAGAAEALRDLVEADFVTAAHQLTFNALKALISRGETPDAVAALGELRRSGRVSSWPTPSASVGNYLHDLAAGAPGRLGWTTARLAVLEAAVRRRMHQAGVRLVQASGEDPFEGLGALLSSEARSVTQLALRLPLPAVSG